MIGVVWHMHEDEVDVKWKNRTLISNVDVIKTNTYHRYFKLNINKMF